MRWRSNYMQTNRSNPIKAELSSHRSSPRPADLRRRRCFLPHLRQPFLETPSSSLTSDSRLGFRSRDHVKPLNLSLAAASEPGPSGPIVLLRLLVKNLCMSGRMWAGPDGETGHRRHHGSQSQVDVRINKIKLREHHANHNMWILESFSFFGCQEHSSAPLSLRASIMSPSVCGQMNALLVTLVILLLLSISGFCASLSAARINQLPGFDGILPFHLETGYVTVDEEGGAELFYYFAESERNPTEDPLILWLVGGPYCSAFVGFALDMGPVKFKIEQYNGSLPTLIYNPYSWTKISSILFLDWPVGTGFSFSRSIEDYVTDEVQSSKQIYKFLKKWLLDHPIFLSNPFYVGGDSYGGKMAPLVALEIVGGNEGFQLPLVNLKGYLIGNPVTGERIDSTSQAPHAHGLGIISDELLKLIETNCEGEDYFNTKNALCAANLKIFNEFLSEINIYDILEPKCVYTPSNVFSEARKSLEEKKTSISLSLQSKPDIDCINGPLLSYYWSNNNLAKEALHIKQGTVEEWQRCRSDLKNYTYNIASSVPHHLNLISRGYRALVYSGDHDLDVPFIGTLDWVKSLNFSILEDWHSWHAGGQVAGYTVLFSNNLTFATVKGGSHTPPDNMPRQSFSMFERWISHQLL